MGVFKRVGAGLLAVALLVGGVAGCTKQGNGANIDKAYVQAAEKAIFRTSDYFDPPETIHSNPWTPPGVGGMGEYVYERLADYVPLPEAYYYYVLAEEFITESKKTTVKLRQGIKWHDGEEFNSDDLICTLNLGFLADWQIWRYIETVDVIDEYTVQFNWTEDNPNVILPLLANVCINSPEHIYGKWAEQAKELTKTRKLEGTTWDQATLDGIQAIRKDLDQFKPDVKDCVGTGPFTITNTTSSEAILDKYDEHWKVENIHFNQVVMKRYTSLESYLANVMGGEYDIEGHGLSMDVFNQMEKENPNMRVAYGLDLGQPGMQFNTSKYPIDIPEVRKAIIYAVDRNALLPIAEPGTKEGDKYITGMVPIARDAWFDESFLGELTDYTYNPNEANKILEGIGWKKNDKGLWENEKGEVVKLEISSMNAWPIFFICGDAIASQLKQFGFDVTFKSMEFSAYLQYLDSGDHMMNMNFAPGALYYGIPWESYNSVYTSNAQRFGFLTLEDMKSKNKEIVLTRLDGSEVNVTDKLTELKYEKDPQKSQMLAEEFASMTNELAFFMPFGEKHVPQKIHNPLLTNIPEDPKDPVWYGFCQKIIIKLMREHGMKYEVVK